MQRYNLFKPIHKGLRALLYDTALIIQQTEFSEKAQSEAVINKLCLLINIFESHARYQQYFVFPAAEKFNHALISEFKAEQVEARKLISGIIHLITLFKNVSSPEEECKAAAAMSEAFMNFMIYSLNQMSKTESLLNQLLWDHFNNRELFLIEQEMFESIPAAEMTVYGRWMIKGMSDSELIRWLNKLKDSAPEYLYQNLLTLTQIELPSSRWHKIEEATRERPLIETHITENLFV